jgi:hypothetical protein
MRVIMGLAGVLVVAFLGLSAYVRLAPTDPEVWNEDLSSRHAPLGPPSVDQVTSFGNGAYADLTKASLAKLDVIAMATPRTKRVAGSVDAGRITWETRSFAWGFPDYTTAQVLGEGLIVLARARYGSSDWGVNGRRLKEWIAALQS